MDKASLMSTHHVVEDIALAIALLNLVVSIAIAVSASYATCQKVLQILLVWLVPVVGGVLFGVFILSQRENTKSARYPSENPHDVQDLWSRLLDQDGKQ